MLSQEAAGQKQVSQSHTLLSQSALISPVILLFLGSPFTVARITYCHSAGNWPRLIHVAPYEAGGTLLSLFHKRQHCDPELWSRFQSHSVSECGEGGLSPRLHRELLPRRPTHVEDSRSPCSLLPGFDVTAPFPVALRSDPGIKDLNERLVQHDSSSGATCSGHTHRVATGNICPGTPVLLLVETCTRKSRPPAGRNSERRLWDHIISRVLQSWKWESRGGFLTGTLSVIIAISPRGLPRRELGGIPGCLVRGVIELLLGGSTLRGAL